MDIMIYDVAGRKIAIRIDFTKNTVCKSFFFLRTTPVTWLGKRKVRFFLFTQSIINYNNNTLYLSPFTVSLKKVILTYISYIINVFF